MKKNYFKKLISAVIALLMIFPATPGYMAGAQEIEADADEMIISPDFESGFSSESTTPAAITYNVLYNDNTGFDIPELAEGPYHEGEEVTVVENTFVNEGYSFSGWNSSPDGEGDGYEPGDILIMPDHDVTLFAQWEAESILMAPLMLPSFVSTSLEFSKDADTDVLMTTGYSTNGQTEVRKLWVHNDIIYVATIGYLKDITRIEFNGVDVGAFNVYSASDRSVPLVIDSVPYYVDGLDPPTKRDNSYWIVVGFSLSSDITFTSPFTLSIITEATGGHGIDSVPVSILNGYMINYYIDGTETRVPDISPNPDMETSFLTGWVDLPPHPTSANYTVKAGQPTQIYLTGKDDYINIYYVPKAFVLTVKHVYDGTEDVDLRTATNVPYDGSVNESKIDKTGFSFSNVTTSPDLTDENISGGNVTGKMPLSAVTITFYYTRNSNNLTVKHVYDGTEDTTITTTVSTPYNAAVSKSKVDKAGFTFSEITTEPDLLNENITAGTVTGNMPNASVIITFTYTRDSNNLTVKHVYDGTEDTTITTTVSTPYDAAISKSKVDKTGFTFSGITTEPDLLNENITAGTVTGNMPNASVIITFTYTRNSNNLTVKHVYDGTEDTSLTTTVSTPYEAAVSKSKIDKTGFTFSGITTEPDLLNENITAGTVTGNMPNASVIITFTYTRDSNNLTVKHVYDGTEDTSLTTTVSTPYEAAVSKSKIDKTGFTFSGITTEPDLLNENITAGTVTGNMPNASVIITFTYTRDSNNLTVKHVYDGTEDTALTTTVSTPYDAAVSKSKVDKTGFTFSGITTDVDLTDEDTTTLGTITGKMPDEHVIITFTYTRNSNNLTVKHVYDGTEDTSLTTTVSTPYEAAVSKSKVDKTGFTFSGITTDVDLTDEDTTTHGTITGKMPDEHVTITFTYTRNSKNLTVKHVYDGTEDTSLTTTVSTPYDAAVSKSKVDKTGFTYSGITTEPDLLNENITAGTVTGKMPDGSVTITFTYTLNPYYVYYNSNYGTPSVISDELNPYEYGEKVTVLANMFTRSGYSFTGWNTQSDGKGISYTAGKEFFIEGSDVTLYAQWNRRSNPPVIIVDTDPPLATLEKFDHFAYIIGYPEGDVRPLNNITREEVAMIFYRLLTDESRNKLLSDTNPFTDLQGHGWSNRAISTLYNAGVLKGYPDGTFRPSEPITRAEFATISAKFDNLEMGSTSKFTDIFGHWAEVYISSSETKGWIKGYPDMTFRPEQDITRAESMTLINNVLERSVPKENIHPDAVFWPDNPSDAWYFEVVMEATNSHNYIYEDDKDELWTDMKANKVWP